MNKNIVVVSLVAVAAISGYFFLKPKTGHYVPYTPEACSQTTAGKRIYFFSSNDCPTCKQVDVAIRQNPEVISEGTVIFKVDYDAEPDLTQKHNVTSPHTFVEVNAEGKEISRWNTDDDDPAG